MNAPLFAEQRGIAVRLITDPVSEEYRNVLTIRGVLNDGSNISVADTLTGTKQIEKIVEINGYDVEVPFAEHLIVMLYTDRPGIVAIYGKEFGDANINIAGMQIARHQRRRPGAQRAHGRLAGSRGPAREAPRRDRRRPAARDRHHRELASPRRP